MGKQDIKKLLEGAERSLQDEYEAQANMIKTELRSLKTKTLDKIQKSIP
ncbi:MAG: hypothetical protein ACK4TO_03665 [Candidatus Nitrosotenuis sp.]